MSDSPDPVIEALADAMTVTYLRGGTSRTVLRHPPLAWPYAVVGQAADTAVMLRVGTDGPRVRIDPGEGYAIPPGMLIAVQPIRSDGRPGVFYWSHVHLRLWGQIDLLGALTQPVPLPATTGRAVGRLCRELVRRSERPDATANPLLVAAEKRRLLSELAAHVIRHASGLYELTARLSRVQRMLPVLAAMRDHMHRPWRLNQFAAMARLSPSRFHDLFQQAVGATPMEHLARLRIKRAQEALAATDLPVNRVGQLCGFGDPFHFSRQFKARVGMSPRAFRRQSASAWPPMPA